MGIFTRTAIAAVLLLSAAACKKAAKQEETGDVFVFKLTELQKTSVGKEQNENRFTAVLSARRQYQQPERMVLDATLQELAVAVNSGGVSLQYDSRDKSGNSEQIARAAQSLVGAQFTALTQPGMKTIDLQGFDKFKSGTAGQIFAGSLDEQSMMRNLRKMFLGGRYLRRPPLAEDTWTALDEIRVDDATLLAAELTYTLSELNAAEARVTVTGKAKLLDPVTREPLSDIQVMEQSVQGSIVWDRKRETVTLADARYLVVGERLMGVQQVQTVVDYTTVTELLSPLAQ